MTFPRVLCAAGQWTDISAGMVVGKSYTLQTRGVNPFWLCEKDVDPVDADSLFSVKDRQFMAVNYAGVAFQVKPVLDRDIHVEIQEAQ